MPTQPINISIMYFASLSEQLGCREERITLPAQISLGELKQLLTDRGESWLALEDTNIRSALNQSFAKDQKIVADGDEVAFFPPVTGG